MTAPALDTPSAFLAMHRRYEANSREYEILDAALTEARRTGDSDRYRLEHAQDASIAEANALRLAILYQVPRTVLEAAALQFHIADTFELVKSCENRRDHEENALAVATQSLLNYLACGMQEDHEQTLGERFRDEAVKVYFITRHRTGEMEG